MWRLNLGAVHCDPSTVTFKVWAPRARSAAIKLVNDGRPPISMQEKEEGYYVATVERVKPGSHYQYILDGDKTRPDPASHWQPQGVHGPSATVDHASFQWSDQRWIGITMDRLIIYELHVGTFTKDGTFQAIIPHLGYLRDQLGVTAIEVMPVAQFPGTRNWGYDGVYPFAPQTSYGGVEGLKYLVDACHAQGVAVILDVVYNHLGPEGNYLDDFGPYFTDHYRTPWGRAINFDGPDSDGVRQYVIGNALSWVTNYHIDGLRLDAIHGIYDFGAEHVLRELTEEVHRQGDRLGRPILVTAESDLNDVRVIAPPSEGGYGLDGQWSDDLHHALHTALTGEHAGYYEDFGRLEQIATALQEGFVYSGQRSPHRKRRHGNSARRRPPSQLIVCSQNHDQIGNRAFGDRLSTLVPSAALKVAAAAVLLAPQTPLLFMGEEYGETAPFLYFIDHGDPDLVEAVRQGRRKEFAAFRWTDVPDPQDPATFERSRIHPGTTADAGQTALLQWYRELIRLRTSIPALGAAATTGYECRVSVHLEAAVLTVLRRSPQGDAALLVLGFNSQPTALALHEPAGMWALRLFSENKTFGGQGRTALPERLTVNPEGVTLALAPYEVAVYLSQPA